jgi:hypothetical protein
MQESLGPDEYAKAYAIPRSIKQAFLAADRERVTACLNIDRHPGAHGTRIGAREHRRRRA